MCCMFKHVAPRVPTRCPPSCHNENSKHVFRGKKKRNTVSSVAWFEDFFKKKKIHAYPMGLHARPVHPGSCIRVAWFEDESWSYFQKGTDSLLAYDFEKMEWRSLNDLIPSANDSFSERISKIQSSFMSEENKKSEMAKYLLTGKWSPFSLYLFSGSF